MRQLVVADLHYSLGQWDWVARNAGQFDSVVIAGDLLDIASGVDRDAQIIVILKYLARISRSTPHLLVTSGNHDLEEPDASGDRSAQWLARARDAGVQVDGDSCALGDWLITLCPWWESEASRDAIAAQLRTDAARPKAHWMWIHHAPPYGARTSWNGHSDAGDQVLTAWIQEFQPDLVLSGHIHQAPFKAKGAWADRIGSTWVFNMGSYGASEPPFIILDLDLGRAEWISAAGREQLDLNLPRRPVTGPAWTEVEGGCPTPHPPSPGDPPAPRTGPSNPQDTSSSH